MATSPASLPCCQKFLSLSLSRCKFASKGRWPCLFLLLVIPYPSSPVSRVSRSPLLLSCATDEAKLWLSPSAKQHRNTCSGSPPVYQDLSTRHDRSVKKAIVVLPISMKGNSKCPSDNSLTPLGARNKDLGAASQTLLTEFAMRATLFSTKVQKTQRLRRRLALRRNA